MIKGRVRLHTIKSGHKKHVFFLSINILLTIYKGVYVFAHNIETTSQDRHKRNQSEHLDIKSQFLYVIAKNIYKYVFIAPIMKSNCHYRCIYIFKD